MKFLKKGIRHNGKYYPASYSAGRLISDSRNCITITARCFLKGLPKELNTRNESDILSDYHDKDRVRIFKDNPLYEDLLSLT